MNSTIRFLIISAAIIIPWAFINVADLEIRIRNIIVHMGISDLGIIAILIIPPVTWFVTKWLFGPRGRQTKPYSPVKLSSILGGKHGRKS